MSKRLSPQVFISYSHKDQKTAEKLAEALTIDGISVWYDTWQIHVGDSIVRNMQDGLTSSDFLVILLSSSSTISKWVEQELNAAIVRNVESGGVFVLPVLIEKCQIPPFLSDKKYADFTRDWVGGYQELLSAIDHHFQSEGHNRRAMLDARLAIVHVLNTVEDDYPIVRFTIMNRSGKSQVINRLEYDVLLASPALFPPITRVLKPIDVWDIGLPYATFKGESHDYSPTAPILLADDDAVTIGLRFYVDYHDSPVSPIPTVSYRIRVRFMSDVGLVAASNVFDIPQRTLVVEASV